MPRFIIGITIYKNIYIDKFAVVSKQNSKITVKNTAEHLRSESVITEDVRLIN